jgi:hypothetical protein
MDATLQLKPLGTFDRLKSAAKVLVTGALPNPLASEPKEPSRAKLVESLNKWCKDEREFWKPVFDRIREEQRFSAGKQWPINYTPNTDMQEPYVGDVVQQMINRKTAGLYAKNPSPEAVLTERMNFAVWDGEQETIENAHAILSQFAEVMPQAQQLAAQGVPVPAPPPQVDQAKAILDDYNQGMDEKKLLGKVADTATLLIKQQWNSQSPDFMVCAKQAVTRIITSRVAFVKVMYKRDSETLPTESANTMDFASKLASLKQQLTQIEQDIVGADDAKVEEANLLKASIEKQIADMPKPEEAFGEEGVVFDWLSATSVIVDRHCRSLREFVGAHRVAHELLLSVEECEAKFSVNLRDTGAKVYTEDGQGYVQQESRSHIDDDPDTFNKAKVCVWHIEDKDTGISYVVCDGVKDFLKEPEVNEPEVNRFWSIVAITFNCQEVEINKPDMDVTIYPRSDVRLAMPMQRDINTAGEGLREHRVANRPAWIGVKSKFASTAGENDLNKLSRPRAAHNVMMLEALNSGEKIADFIQPLPTKEIDPKMYDTSPSSQAMMLSTGQQPSDIGTQRPDEKATGQNIAAAARATSEASNIDDLNFGFSTLAQMTWEMLIQEMPEPVVKKLVGRGATWPVINREDIAEAIYFQVEAGSMGPPNQQAEIQKIQVLAPQLISIFAAMGKSPEPLLKLVIKAWDVKIDVDELLKDIQLQQPAQPAQEQQKLPSVSISAKLPDFTPEEQDQIVPKYFGIKPASPQSRLLTVIGHDKGVQAAHENKVGAQTPSGAQPAPKPQPQT